LSRYGAKDKIGNDVLYIDIDYPDLINIKCQVVKDTPQISKLLQNVEYFPAGTLKLVSDSYITIGLDLLDLKTLDNVFESRGYKEHAIFFTSEVAITYMDKLGADKLIEWAASLPDGESIIITNIRSRHLTEINSKVLCPRADTPFWAQSSVC